MLAKVIKIGFFRGIAATGSLVAAFTISHYYGIEAYGRFSVIIALLSLLVVVTKCGTDLYVIKYVSFYHEIRNYVEILSIIRNALYISSSFFVLVAISLLFYLYFSQYNEMYSLFFVLPLLVWQTVVASTLKAIGRQATAAIYELGFVLLIISISVFLSGYLGTELRFELITIVASVFILLTLVIPFYFFYKLKVNHVKVLPEFVIDKKSSKELIDFLILSLLAFIPTNGFPLLLADKLPDEEVGILAVCFRIALLINFIVTIVNSIAMPKFSVSYKKEGGELHKYYKKYNLFLWVTCFPILLFIMCFNSMILSFFSVDEGFEWVLIIMVLGQLINILTGNVTALLNMIGLQRLNRNITIFSSLFAVLSLYILSGYGIYFAAMSVSLYWGLKNFISAFYIWKHVGINCFKVT